MSDEARVNIIRGFTDDDRLCIKIVDDELNQVYDMTCINVLYTITEHTHYWRCNDLWYPTNNNGVERMMSDIQRELQLGAAQMIELDQAIADLMIVGG